MKPLNQEVKESCRLAFPIVIAQVGNMSMGLVDSYVVGQVSSTELAAVAAGNSAFWTASVIGLGLLFGMDPIVSQAFGRKDFETCNQSLGFSLILSSGLALLVVPLLLFLAWNYHLTGATPEIVAATSPYLEVVTWSFPLILWFTCFQRYWQGLGIAAPMTIIILIANILNLISDLILVQGRFGIPPLGATGVGYSTLVCRIFTLIAILGVSKYYWKNNRHKNLKPLTWQHLFPLNLTFSKKFLRLGLPSASQVALEVFAFSLTTLLIGRLGATQLATHHIVLSIASFTFMFPMGLSSAIAVRVGYHLGREFPQDSKYAGWLGIRMGVGIMMIFGLILYFLPDPLIGIFTNDLNVLNVARDIIFLCSLFQVFDGLQVVAAGALRGLGDTKTSLYANLFSHYLIGLPVGLSLCFWFDKGLMGLWIGLALGLFFVAIINLYFWNRKAQALR